ncbi:hypothetical protein RJ640_002712 [Escallonia rubra]|uniref:RNase H type-1 domain-containing protein n=1 Tax=Escallonia rubra TaxID=112253 RepID=A0AA88UU46_9ASTE|nr:hypothetical protein RJ640_002712 [Escallonia rubra]
MGKFWTGKGREEDGVCMALMQNRGIIDSRRAELWAFKSAFTLAWKESFRWVVVESDALEVLEVGINAPNVSAD